jgi:hypothetical protein
MLVRYSFEIISALNMPCQPEVAMPKAIQQTVFAWNVFQTC